METVRTMPMRETLDELTKVAAALNRESDSLNAVIDDFEEQLESAGVGVSLWLSENYRLDQSDWHEHFDQESEKSWQESDAKLLGYTKLEGKWRVATKDVVLKNHGGKDDWGNVHCPCRVHRGEAAEWDVVVRRHEAPTPLAQASRAVRIEAVAHFEALAKALTEKMKSHLTDIAKAKKLVKE